MISRATVSPKSMIDAISSRSDSSMPPASAASSARARISSSVTNGPCFRPLPGRITLVSTDEAVGPTSRKARPTNATIGAVSSAARSVCWSAQVFGAASATTNTHDDVDDGADGHAPPAEQPRRRRTPVSDGLHGLDE